MSPRRQHWYLVPARFTTVSEFKFFFLLLCSFARFCGEASPADWVGCAEGPSRGGSTNPPPLCPFLKALSHSFAFLGWVSRQNLEEGSKKKFTGVYLPWNENIGSPASPPPPFRPLRVS